MRHRPPVASSWFFTTTMLFVAAASLLAQAPSPVPAASPKPGPPRVTFASEVAYVEVDAIVTDQHGEPIRDLKKEEFIVLEDGKPQTIELFAQIDIPYERPEQEPFRPPVEIDVSSNEHPFEGRLYIMVLDELHTYALRSGLVRAAARRFLERNFAEGDLAAVVHTSGSASAGQELTGNRRLLLAAVDRFLGRKMQSVTQSRVDQYRRTQDTRQRGDRVNDPDEYQRAYDARSSLDVLKGVADFLAPIHGRRKAVLFFSEGIDYDMGDTFNNREATTVIDSMKDATAAAVRANASFYTIDPRGLGGLSDESMQMQPVFDDPSLGLDGQGLQRDFQRSQDSLRVLAEETLGLAAVNVNDFTTAFNRLVKDNSAYYVVGYYPANQKRADGYHKLEVKVSRPGVRVRARSGYSKVKAKTEKKRTLASSEVAAPLLEMLNSPLPRPGLTMSVQAAPFRGQAGKAALMVAVQFAGGSFRFTQKDGQAHDTIDLAVVATDAAGKSTSSNNKVQLSLKANTRQVVDAAGFRVVSWLDVPPGRYQVRVAGRAVNSDVSGSVFTDVEVPAFAKEDLTMSGLVLTSAITGIVPTAGPLQFLKDVLPAPPTTRRAFPSADTLAVMTEVYDTEKVGHTIDVVTTLTAADGTVAFRQADERKTDALLQAGVGGAIVHVAQIPLKPIVSGTYTLKVEARSRMGKKPPVAVRETLVQVLPADEPVIVTPP